MAKWKGLTDSELEILAVIWAQGPATVRQVIDHLPKDRNRGYTTTLKMLQLMHEKGLVERNEETRAHVYKASMAADQAKQGIVRDLVNRLFGGSSKALAMNALGTDYDPDQLADLEATIDKLERER